MSAARNERERDELDEAHRAEVDEAIEALATASRAWIDRCPTCAGRGVVPVPGSTLFVNDCPECGALRKALAAYDKSKGR